MNGDSALTTLALYADGVEIGGGTASPASATWSPSTAGEHALTAVATYANGVSVTSPVVDVYSGTLSVTAGGWEPDPAYVGQIIGGDVSATVSGGLDSDGSGPFYATFDWETARVPVPGTTTCETMTAIWESPDGDAVDAEGNGPTAFTTYSGSYSLAWLPYTIAKNRFDATFNDAGYYILKVQCTASIHDSRTGSAVGSLSSSGYVGGTASDVGDGEDSGDSDDTGMAARPMQAASAPPPGASGKKVTEVKVELIFRSAFGKNSGFHHGYLLIIDGTGNSETMSMGPMHAPFSNWPFLHIGTATKGYDSDLSDDRWPPIILADDHNPLHDLTYYGYRFERIALWMIDSGPSQYFAGSHNSNSFMYTLLVRASRWPGHPLITGHIPTKGEVNALVGGNGAPTWGDWYPVSSPYGIWSP